MLNPRETRRYLKESDFETLFNGLSWDNHTQILNITVDKTGYQLTAIAQKRGMVVFECAASESEGHLPDYATRRKIQKQVAKSFHKNRLKSSHSMGLQPFLESIIFQILL